MEDTAGLDGFEEQLKSLANLAMDFTRSRNDEELFRMAANTVQGVIKDVCHISVALLLRDESALFYFTLSPTVDTDHAHIGTLTLQDTAAGTATQLKEAICTGNFSQSQQQFLDWQHFNITNGAVSLISAPLMVSEKVLGTLNIGSTLTEKFVGQQMIVATMAALLSPLVALQRFRKEAKVVSGFLERMLPAHALERVGHEQDLPQGPWLQQAAAAAVMRQTLPHLPQREQAVADGPTSHLHKEASGAAAAEPGSGTAMFSPEGEFAADRASASVRGESSSSAADLHDARSTFSGEGGAAAGRAAAAADAAGSSSFPVPPALALAHRMLGSGAAGLPAAAAPGTPKLSPPSSAQRHVWAMRGVSLDSAGSALLSERTSESSWRTSEESLGSYCMELERGLSQSLSSGNGGPGGGVPKTASSGSSPVLGAAALGPGVPPAGMQQQQQQRELHFGYAGAWQDGDDSMALPCQLRGEAGDVGTAAVRLRQRRARTASRELPAAAAAAAVALAQLSEGAPSSSSQAAPGGREQQPSRGGGDANGRASELGYSSGALSASSSQALLRPQRQAPALSPQTSGSTDGRRSSSEDLGISALARFDAAPKFEAWASSSWQLRIDAAFCLVAFLVLLAGPAAGGGVAWAGQAALLLLLAGTLGLLLAAPGHYAQHRNKMMAGLRCLRTAVFLASEAEAGALAACSGGNWRCLLASSGALLLALQALSFQVIFRIHARLQALNGVAVACAAGWRLWGRPQLLAEALLGLLALGLLLPSALLLCKELCLRQLCAAQRKARRAQTAGGEPARVAAES